MNDDAENANPEEETLLREMAERARALRIEADREVAEARSILEKAERTQAESAQREAFLRTWLKTEYGRSDLDEAAVDGQSSEDGDWLTKARTSAVEDAVRSLSATSGTATPGKIEDFLRQQGRDDDRVAIGAALAYLHRNGRLHNIARGQWVPVGEVIPS